MNDFPYPVQWLLACYAGAMSLVMLSLAMLWRQRERTKPDRWQVERDASGRRLKERL